MIRKFLLLAFNILIAATYLYAQKDAKRVLDNVNSKIKASKGITANFTYSTKDFNNNDLGRQEGRIIIKGDSYYILQGNTEIMSDGEKVWNYDGDKEVMVTDAADENNKMLNPRNLLSGQYEKDFSYKLIPSRTNLYVIQLTPLDKRKVFKIAYIYIDKAKNVITKANVVDRGGNTISFAFSNITTEAAIDESKFQFDAARHPGVEVITQ